MVKDLGHQMYRNFMPVQFKQEIMISEGLKVDKRFQYEISKEVQEILIWSKRWPRVIKITSLSNRSEWVCCFLLLLITI